MRAMNKRRGDFEMKGQEQRLKGLEASTSRARPKVCRLVCLARGQTEEDAIRKHGSVGPDDDVIFIVTGVPRA